MRRKVYLLGELGEKFGSSFTVYADTLEQACKIISVNRPGFDKYLYDCIENNIGISVAVEENPMDSVEDVILPLQKGDITMALTPAGAGGDNPIVDIIIGAILFTINPALAKSATMTQKFIHAAINTIAASLVSRGINALMAPDPGEDGDEPTNYLFNGEAQNIVEGDPVPVLYGELRIPGSPISMASFTDVEVSEQHIVDSHGNIFIE